MIIHTILRRISTPFRRRRMHRFESLYQLTSDLEILDVGGMPSTWDLIDAKPRVTLLNLTLPADSTPEHITSVVGDGTSLPYDDGAFDIVFSNSVIEHLYSWENQLKFAKEVRRVGKRYSVETPNRAFPIEPHYLTPFIHFLPKRMRVRVLRNFTVWGWITRPDAEYCRRSVDEIRLLNRSEMRELFPEAELHPETFLGLVKSFTAVKR